MKKLKNRSKENITLICFAIASLCFFVNAIIGIVKDDGSNWVVNLCLGSTFLCLSSTHISKDEDK